MTEHATITLLEAVILQWIADARRDPHERAALAAFLEMGPHRMELLLARRKTIRS